MRACWKLAAWGLVLLAGGGVVRADATIVAGPMIGHVTDSSARVWLQISTTDDVSVTWFDNDSGREGPTVAATIEGPPPFVFDAPINGLKANHDYRLQIQVAGQDVKLPNPQPIIRTAPSAGLAGDMVLAFGSGVDPADYPRQPIFDTVARTQPRAFLFLGDVGALAPKLADWPKNRRKAFRYMCDEHRTVRALPDLRPLLRTVPTYATWDDRDFGVEGADKTFPFSKESLIAFQKYWPNPSYGNEAAAGTFCTFSIGDADVFLLDNRSYRDPVTGEGGGGGGAKALFGAKQMEWLEQSLQKSTATFKIVASGSGFLSDAPGSNNWQAFAGERDGFISWLYGHHVPGAVFLSGGRSYAELSVYKPPTDNVDGYTLYDLTSSTLAGLPGTDAEKAIPNGRRVGQAFFEHNFGALSFAGPEGHRHLILRVHDEKGGTQIERTVFANDLRGQW